MTRPPADFDYSRYLNQYRDGRLRVPPLDFEIDETPPVRRAGALSRAALVIAAIVGFAAGYALGDVPDVPAEAFTNCYSTGC